MSDAILRRGGRKLVQLVEASERKTLGSNFQPVGGEDFIGYRMADMIRVSLSAGRRAVEGSVQDLAVVWLDRMALEGRDISPDESMRVERARRWSLSGGMEIAGLQGADQFGNALENALHRTLSAAYTSTRTDQHVWRTCCDVKDATDFRPQIHNFLGGVQDMRPAKESGQYEIARVGDTEKGQIEVEELGTEIRISRKTIVNDDLGLLVGLAERLGFSAHRTIENLFFAELAKRSNLGEFPAGTNMFSTARGNLKTGTAALTSATLFEGMVAIETQKDPGGHGYSGLSPDTLLVHPMQYGIALTILNDRLEWKGSGGPSDAGVRGMIPNVLKSPRLTNQKRWLLLDSGATPFAAAFLHGMDSPYLDQMEPWSRRGTVFLGAIDAEVSPISYRGAYLNKGTA